MAAEKSPAFQFYPKEFLTDGNVAGMSLQEVGAYIRLLCYCWQEGSLPTTTTRLAQMAGVPERAFLKFWPAVRACFQQQEERFVHPRLEKERQKQATHRQRQSDKGKASAAARAESQPESNRGSTAVQPDGNRPATDRPPDGQPEVNSPISDLRNVQERACEAGPESERVGRPPVPVRKANGAASSSDETAVLDRAREFIEHFPQIYAEYRHGAHYQVREARDFPIFLELAQGWPQPGRLEDMFRVFLHLKGKDVLNQPGSPGQFRHHAPECDALLRAEGR